MKIKIMISLVIFFLFIGTTLVSSHSLRHTDEEEEEKGYILFSPVGSRKTFLMDYSGKIVHTWKSKNFISGAVYLLENGNLLRGCRHDIGFSNLFNLMKIWGGKVEMFDWEGNLIWEYSYSDKIHCLHNDIEPLPNGNILMGCWEYKTKAEAIKAGINESSLHRFGGLLTDIVIEVEPTYPRGGKVVWKWSPWDHLIQDIDPERDNYGVVDEHPELIDINAHEREELEEITGILARIFDTDFQHLNGIDYNEKLDQIVLSTRHFGEIWIVDHSTTTEEAAGHSGGRYGKGGDLLYRWGNPRRYDAGTKEDQMLFMQHDPRWIEDGRPGEGHITIFNNGLTRPDEEYSQVLEIVPPVDNEGNYSLGENGRYGPEEPIWSYTAEDKTSFFSEIMSGAQRLPNGNTLICSAKQKRFFEVTPEKEIVWEYYNWRPIPFGRLNDLFKIQYYPPDYPGLQKLFEN